MLVMGYIPCASEIQAKKIGNALVKEKLAACANVFPRIQSFYIWKNENQNSTESLLAIKTLKEKIPAIENRVRELHSYEVPCIAFYEAVHINTDYLNWVKSVIQ
jgi:periplasmic divalent cation tolerance protein